MKILSLLLGMVTGMEGFFIAYVLGKEKIDWKMYLIGSAIQFIAVVTFFAILFTSL